MKRKIAVLSGAGISAESGLRTFRDSGGLWEGYDVYQVATPEGWRANPGLVLHFYNERRKACLAANPNTAHLALARLEQEYEVAIVTQNVDDLHERAGSTNVMHLHGSLLKARSTKNEEFVCDIQGDLHLGDCCPQGGQLRPHIVWFGEAVLLMEEAAQVVGEADIFIVIGTSLQVYPAAGLLHCASDSAMKYIIDPAIPALPPLPNLRPIAKKATAGMEEVLSELLPGSQS